MTHVMHRQIGKAYPVAVHGEGVHIYDSTGKQYIDASGGAAVSCLGHGHKDVIDAMKAQLDKLEFAHTSFFTTPALEELADDLAAHAPPGLSHTFFVSGGSEAIEAAIKMARQVAVERGEPQRWHLISRRQSYHGITFGALAIGGRASARRDFSPLLIETHHVSPVYEYRDRRANETPEAYGERLAQELEAKIDELGGDNVLAFIAETVVGATLGAVPAVPGYFKRVREIASRRTDLCTALANALSAQLSRVFASLADDRLHTAPQRVARYLLSHCAPDGRAVSFRLPYQKSLLAGKLGLAPEALSRAFSLLRNHGVNVRGRLVQITDPEALRRV